MKMRNEARRDEVAQTSDKNVANACNPSNWETELARLSRSSKIAWATR